MTHLISRLTILTLVFFSCSTSVNKDKADLKDTSSKSTTQISKLTTDDAWTTFKDTINTGFIVTFKYPKKLYAAHFENGECIGKKIKMIDDGPMTTMDCCMWMDDISEGNNISIDTLVKYDITKFKADNKFLKDTIDIANVKGIRVLLLDKKDKRKILRQSIYFIKYDTFFEVNNDRLAAKDFDVFVQSLKIDK